MLLQRNEFEKGLLTYLTPDQLTKIQNTKIGIAGVGGLGSNIANSLVRTGFIDFELIDADVIEASNLNRQNYFLDEIGFSKVETTVKRLKQINPAIIVKTAKIYLTQKNISDYFRDRDLVFEAFDNIESKKLILENFGNSKKLLIMGNGMAGITDTEIKIKKIKKNIIIVGDQTTQAGPDNPPLAPRVMACAALMASVAINFIMPSPLTPLPSFDGRGE